MNINPKNSENALKMIQTEFETKHVISEKADMTEVDIKNELTVKDIDYTISSEEYQTLLNLLGGVASNPRLYNLILQLVQRFSTADCTITDSGTALSVTAGADTEDGQLAQAVIDAFDYQTAKEILEV